MIDVEAARSRHMPVRGGSDEERRYYLQDRLKRFSALMFVAFVLLIAFLLAMYQAYPEKAPKDNDVIFGGATILLAIMAVVWRGILERRELSIESLNLIDALYSISIGAAFAVSAVLSYPLQSAAYASLVYGVCTVFTRALLVPTTSRRTLAMSTLLFAPMFVAAIYLANATDQELPGPAYAGAAILLGSVAIVLATMGSQIIYGLRLKATQLGQYTLVRLIKAGGMGEVHEARHALLKRPTAIKLIREARLDAKTLRRFEDEVQAMSRLTHPNSVAVFDYGHSFDGRLYYAMEFLDGLDLGRLRGAQPIDRVVSILKQVAGALEEAHGKNLMHRDIKPGNIILCRHGGMLDVVKVVDYGLVEEVKRNAKTELIGTPGYIAPEALTGEAGPAADLFALGAVAYLLLTGTPVFDGTSTAELLGAAIEAEPRPLPANVPAELVAIVMKLLAKDPKARYRSAGELAEALAGVPRQGDWTRDRERAWWDDWLAKQAATPSPDDKTVTMPIDLAKR